MFTGFANCTIDPDPFIAALNKQEEAAAAGNETFELNEKDFE